MIRSRHLTSEYTGRAVFNCRSRDYIGIYPKVGAFSCGYVARLTDDMRLLRFNTGIAEIDDCSGKPLRVTRFRRERFQESLYLPAVTGVAVLQICGP